MTEEMRIDVEALALALHRREYAEFSPEPVRVAHMEKSNRQKAWVWLRKLMIVSAGALLLLSALNTMPVFFNAMSDGDWGFLHPFVAFVQGGAAVLGYEVFLLSAAMMMRLLPPKFPGIGWVRFAFALAFIGGLVANQDALIRPLVAGGAVPNWWDAIKAVVLGAGRFILMIGAGEAAAVIVLGEENADLSDERQYEKRVQSWNETRLADWRARSGSYRNKAQRMVAAGTVPAGLLEAGDETADPFASTPTASRTTLQIASLPDSEVKD